MINVLNLFLSLFLPLPSVKLLNTWYQMDNRYVLVSIEYFIQLHIFHDNNNTNTVWYMILYTDTMGMIPEWLYVNLISLLGNSVMPLALFTGNKKKRKLCSSYYVLISKIDNLLYCGELFFVSFVPTSSLSCYAVVASVNSHNHLLHYSLFTDHYKFSIF